MGRVRVVLRQSVEKVGRAGDVALVAAGFARNYLIPRGLAVPATKGNLKQAETWRRAREERGSREVASAEELRGRLEAAPVRVLAQAGADGRLFGSITSIQVAEAVAASTQIELDRHQIQLPEPIRHLGFHEAEVRLHPDVTARLTVEVLEA